ncbi:hypothetical protein Bca101_021553 [Brassica carinata]
MMDCLMNKSKKKRNSEANQRLRSFQENGKILLQDLIELCNGKSNPIKTFSANQIIEATNNFSESNHMIRFEFIYKGTLENRLVLIKRATYSNKLSSPLYIEYEHGVMNLRVSDRICKIVEEGRSFEIFDPQVLESVADESMFANEHID